MTTRRPKVVYWNNQPSPYVVARFNAVADRGTLDFEAWFDGIREPDRSWDVDASSWRFAARILEPRLVAGRRTVLPIAELRETRPDVFICNYDRRHHMLGAWASLALAGRTAIRALPSYAAWESPSFARDAAKHLLFRAVDGAKVPGADGRAYANRYGLPGERSWAVTQAIDVDLYQSGRLGSVRREHVRAQLGLHGCVFVYVGRIWKGKGLDILFAAYRQVRATQPDVRLLMVGEGMDQERYRRETADLPDVVWHGFAQPQETPALYGACDVMVFPTLGDPNGLVVEEAMTAGLPVITSDAAGDIGHRVQEGVDGKIVPVGDVDALAEAMSDLAEDPPRRAQWGETAATVGERFRMERYAEDFDDFVRGIMARPRRRTVAAVAARSAGRLLLRRRGAEPGAGARRRGGAPAPVSDPARHGSAGAA
jgi:glycosyltransferase involved in cell wall biosynthesis